MKQATRRRPFHALAAVLMLSLALVSACETRASAAQLTWCAENQDEVGRAAIRLGLIADPLTYGEWKDNNPEAYERACVAAFEDA